MRKQFDIYRFSITKAQNDQGVIYKRMSHPAAIVPLSDLYINITELQLGVLLSDHTIPAVVELLQNKITTNTQERVSLILKVLSFLKIGIQGKLLEHQYVKAMVEFLMVNLLPEIHAPSLYKLLYEILIQFDDSLARAVAQDWYDCITEDLDTDDLDSDSSVIVYELIDFYILVLPEHGENLTSTTLKILTSYVTYQRNTLESEDLSGPLFPLLVGEAELTDEYLDEDNDADIVSLDTSDAMATFQPGDTTDIIKDFEEPEFWESIGFDSEEGNIEPEERLISELCVLCSSIPKFESALFELFQPMHRLILHTLDELLKKPQPYPTVLSNILSYIAQTDYLTSQQKQKELIRIENACKYHPILSDILLRGKIEIEAYCNRINRLSLLLKNPESVSVFLDIDLLDAIISSIIMSRRFDVWSNLLTMAQNTLLIDYVGDETGQQFRTEGNFKSTLLMRYAKVLAQLTEKGIKIPVTKLPDYEAMIRLGDVDIVLHDIVDAVLAQGYNPLLLKPIQERINSLLLQITEQTKSGKVTSVFIDNLLLMLKLRVATGKYVSRDTLP